MWRTHYSGWWYTYPSEKYEFVSRSPYSQYMEKIFQTTNQILYGLWMFLVLITSYNHSYWGLILILQTSYYVVDPN